MSSLLICTEEEAEQQWDETIGQTLPPLWLNYGNWWWWLRNQVRTYDPVPEIDPTPIVTGVLNGILVNAYGPTYPTITAPITSSSPTDPVAIIEMTGFSQIAAMLEEAAEEAGYDLWASE